MRPMHYYNNNNNFSTSSNSNGYNEPLRSNYQQNSNDEVMNNDNLKLVNGRRITPSKQTNLINYNINTSILETNN